MTTPPNQAPAAEPGLMAGFPPEREVTHAEQLYAPFNRWSFQHELQLNRTADLWRGAGPVAALEERPRDLSGVRYQNRAGETFSFDDMVEQSYTDGIVVLHQGAIIYERYLNGMQPHTLHAWASGSKSVTGVLAAVVAEIERGGDPAAFARGPAASPGNTGHSYRHQWWVTHNPHGAYYGIGYGGQMLYIDPRAEMVVAKFSSYPTPTTAGQEFWSAFVALPALGKALAE